MLAIIPAKKNSKRLPNKNLKILAGKPLIAHTIGIAKKSKQITRIIVSTDCPKIAKISKKYGAEIPFYRPKKLSRNETSSLEVCRYTVNSLNKIEGKNISSFVTLQPTSPLRLPKDIDKAIKIFKKKKADSVMSFSKAKPIGWHRYFKTDGNFYKVEKKIVKNNNNNYLLNGAIYVFKTSFINKKNSSSNKSYAYVMPKERSVDIDDINDFRYAKYLISSKIKK